MRSTKIAIISDAHGNLEATKEVFKDIKRRKVNKIICLGDIIAKGSHPNECIDLVKKNCDVVLRGNCDRYFTEDHDMEKLPEVEQKRIKWNQSLISDSNKEYLKNLPFCHEFYMSGSLVRLFHASPEVDNEAVLNVDNLTKKRNQFEPSKNTISQKPADIVLFGHIHHQFLDKLYNKTLINVGSVGNAFDVIRREELDSSNKETTNAHYVIIEGSYSSKKYEEPLSIQFLRVPYNIEKELEDLDINLEQENYKYEITEGRYRDMTKVTKYYKSIGIDI